MAVQAILALLTALLPGQAIEGGWQVRRDANHCIASPLSGTAGATLVWSPWTNRLSVVVHPSPIAATAKISVEAFPGGKKLESIARVTTGSDVPTLIVQLPGFAASPGTTSLLITSGGKAAALELTAVDKTLAALTECGIQIKSPYRREQQVPTEDIFAVLNNNLFSTLNYPAEALKKKERGRVTVLLHVAQDGSIPRCDIVGPSASTSLNDGTCLIFREKVRLPTSPQPGERWCVTTITWSL